MNGTLARASGIAVSPKPWSAIEAKVKDFVLFDPGHVAGGTYIQNWYGVKIDSASLSGYNAKIRKLDESYSIDERWLEKNGGEYSDPSPMPIQPGKGLEVPTTSWYQRLNDWLNDLRDGTHGSMPIK